MVTSEVDVERPLSFWMGFVGSSVFTLTLVVANVLYQSSQSLGYFDYFDGPYTYEFWFWPSMLLIAFFVVLGLVALSSPRGSRLAAGLVTGALTGAFLSFIVTAQYYRNQSGEYMIRKAFTFNADVILLGLA